jgi:hypothetical protein
VTELSENLTFRGRGLVEWTMMPFHQLDEPDTDFTFPHTYQVQDRFELPGSGESEIPTIYIPPPLNRVEHDGVWLRVRASSGHAWTGVFANGLGGISRIMSSPDPDSVIVISKGAAYLARADDPNSVKQLPIHPVTDVRVITEHGLVIFANFSRLFAYGPDGLRWESSHLCTDCLKILSVDGGTITGSGYDPVGSTETVHFAVDLQTGEDNLH